MDKGRMRKFFVHTYNSDRVYEVMADAMDAEGDTVKFYYTDFVENNIIAVFFDICFAYEDGTHVEIVPPKEEVYDEMADYGRE